MDNKTPFVEFMALQLGCVTLIIGVPVVAVAFALGWWMAP